LAKSDNFSDEKISACSQAHILTAFHSVIYPHLRNSGNTSDEKIGMYSHVVMCT